MKFNLLENLKSSCYKITFISIYFTTRCYKGDKILFLNVTTFLDSTYTLCAEMKQ